MNKYLPKPAFTFSSTLVFLLGVIFSASTVNADDTDLYLDQDITSDAEPLVMFMLDHRNNLGSTGGNACNNAGNTVTELMTKCGYSTDVATALVNIGTVDAPDNDVNLLDLLSGILAVVMNELSGVKVGLLLPHNDVTTGGCTNFVLGAPSSGCSNGAYIPFGFQTLTDDPDTAADENADTISAFSNVLSNIPTVSGKYHSWQANEMWFEYYRYLTGGPIWEGHHGYADFVGDDAINLDAEDPVAFPNAGPAWDTSIESGSDYVSPIDSITGECTKAFALSFSFGVLNAQDDSDTQMELDVSGANGGGMSTTERVLTVSTNANTGFEDILRHMNNIDLADGDHGLPDLDGTTNVTSYFFVPSPSTTENGFADAGGGRTTAFDLDDSPDEIIDAIKDVFTSILSVSTTFVAPSVPVNVFNRTQTLDAVFLALFEAEEAPHWQGNLKKLTIDTTDGQLEDANGNNAIDNDGRILASALTLWTDASTLPLSTDSDSTDTTDGRSVLRGGSGQNVPGFVTGTPGLSNPSVGTNTAAAGPRKIYTQDPDVTNTIMALNADSATATALWDELMINVSPADVGLGTGGTIAANYASATTDEQDRAINLIRFARGLSGDTTTDDTTKSDWMTSDPLHSRPITINYGDNDGGGGYSETNPNIRIAMATNDGGMRMIVNTEADGSESGREAWVFFPLEALPTLNRLRDNALGGGDPVHPYTTDGSPAAILTDNDLDGNVETADSDTVNMFFGQRRGGKCYYSLDVTDPEEPKFNWKICKTDADFGELALTFSRPTVGKMAEQVINPAAAVTDPITTIDVLVFGGGYNGDDDGTHLGCTQGGSSNDDSDCLDDTAGGGGNTADILLVGKDAAHGHGDGGSVDLTMPTIGEDDDEGNAVFVIEADNGNLIWKARGGSSTGFNSTDSAYDHINMDDSIPSELAAVDTDSDGLLDRIYFGDTGGRVWRIDMPQTDQDDPTNGAIIDNWTATEMLNVGRHAVDSTATDIRFFNRADVVQASDGVAFDAIIIGSGDRANPLGQVREDTFFMLKDRAITSGNPPISETDNVFPKVRGDLADLTLDACAVSVTTGDCAGANIDVGWFIDLGLGVPETGEKNLAAALTLGGTIFFSTFSPVAATSACGLSEGTGKIFAVSLLDATAIFSIDTDNDSDPDNPTLERFAELDSGGIPVETVPLGGDDILILGSADPLRKTGATTSWKTFWYERDTDDTP